jgi:hypothetical protein
VAEVEGFEGVGRGDEFVMDVEMCGKVGSGSEEQAVSKKARGKGVTHRSQEAKCKQ